MNNYFIISKKNKFNFIGILFQFFIDIVHLSQLDLEEITNFSVKFIQEMVVYDMNTHFCTENTIKTAQR